jgi:CBS domain containing-hemolysin-like protein
LEPPLAAKLAGLALLLLLTTLLAAAQSCLLNVNRARLRSLSEQGTTRALAVLRLFEHPSCSAGNVATLLALTLIGAAGLTSLIIQELITVGSIWAWVFPLMALAATLVLQSCGRAFGMAHPDAVALRLATILPLLSSALALVLAPLSALEHQLVRLLGGPSIGDSHSAEEELRLLMQSGDEGGVLEQDEREMIHGIFALSEVTVREIMVPRIDMVAVADSALVGEVVDLIVATGHSRLPIFEENIDNVVGFVYAKDVLKHLKSGRLEDPVRPLARNAHFVPEAKKVDELLGELQQRRVHMAIVVDEYGGTAGLVTIENLLERIVGEIQDEYDQAEEARVEQVSDRESLFDARVTIREVNELLGLHLPDDEVDTLGGLIYDHLGKVPTMDEQVRVDGCVLQVVAIDGRRIKKVRLVVGDEPDLG